MSTILDYLTTTTSIPRWLLYLACLFFFTLLLSLILCRSCQDAPGANPSHEAAQKEAQAYRERASATTRAVSVLRAKEEVLEKRQQDIEDQRRRDREKIEAMDLDELRRAFQDAGF